MYRHLLIKVSSREIFQFLRVQFNALMSLQKFYKTIEFELTLILMKDYELEDSEQIKQVWGLNVGTGFYI